METKEEREARERALEENKRLGWSVEPDFNKQLAEMGTWTIPNIPNNMKRKQNGEEYTVPEHKLLQKFIALEDRIARWKQVGPAVTEQEWEDANGDLEEIAEFRRCASHDPNFKFSRDILIHLNKLWHKYKTKADLLTKNEK